MSVGYRPMQQRIRRYRAPAGPCVAYRNLSLIVTAQMYERVHDYAAARRTSVRGVLEEALEGIDDVTADEVKRERLLSLTAESDAEMRDMTSGLKEDNYDLLALAALELGTSRRMLMRVLLRKHLGMAPASGRRG